jgi:hypothetical protein
MIDLPMPFPKAIGNHVDGAPRKYVSFFTWLVLIGLTVGLSACSQWGQHPRPIQYDSDTTQALLQRVTDVNTDLSAFRGIGRVRVTMQGTERVYERTAWVGSEPGRLRFAFRSPTGMPVFSMSCDEAWLTALNHADGQYFHRQINKNSLSRILPVAITCADLYGLLVGRPPQVDYDAVRMAPAGRGDADTIVLLLQRRFRGTVGRISIARDTGELSAAELLDVHGKRLYAARVDARQTIDGYRLPVKIRLTGPDGSLELDVQRTWPAASVSRDFFKITPPPSD